ncbi:terminase TerL endonuclease subunit [Paucilactobacillus hokkaidonensis]|uniref:terminase TerL endonuclease subunit n=1 Tax=Paucilactobacillus hokkaidonensis TaxID=1193095 RepID=UPI000A92C2A2|nr:terminase TerL endonuclease subunit [Paucilactobacillus hokkaidonensis]
MVISRKRQNKLSRNSHESGKFDSHHYLLAVADEQGDDKRIGKIKENNGKITSGQIQTANHQYFQISTAYPDSNSYFYHDEQMIKEVMMQDYDRTLDDYLCIVYEQDELSETEQPELWPKSNPILGLDKEKHDLMLKSLLSERDTKMQDGSLAEFQNKNLNMWLQVKVNSYLDLDDINNAVVTEPPFDIKGHSVYVGFDKSNFSDDTSISFIFPYQHNGKK